MKRAGVFGTTESGKTTLVRHLSLAYWCKFKTPSLILDPHLDRWGPQAWVTSKEDEFWDVVWTKRTHSLVIVEEACTTIRRERELTPVFTMLRHRHHKLIVIGHDGSDLLPVMRRAFTDLYLFVQSPDAIDVWQRDLPDMKGLEAAAGLGQFEFLRCQKFKVAERCKLGL